MKIASFTLAGPGTAGVISDALRSVAEFVDSRMVIATEGPTEDRDDLFNVIVDLSVRQWRLWPWRNDFAAARNAGLGFACESSADFACMVDADERVICPDAAAFRSWLEALPDAVQVVLVRHHDGSHTRERFFRLPARYRFQGRTHEMYPCPAAEQVIAPAELIMWAELPKTREQLRAKFERDVAMLAADLDENPRNGAACYYLGISLQSLALYAREDGDEEGARRLFESALDSYRRHREIDTSGVPAWHEGTAFSCYRAAECYLALGQPDRAIDCAAAGMVLDAGIAELPWIAAVASLQVGRLEQARCWAEMAKTHAMGSEAERRRVGFRLPRGLTTGPDEVLECVRAATSGESPCSWIGIGPAASNMPETVGGAPHRLRWVCCKCFVDMGGGEEKTLGGFGRSNCDVCGAKTDGRDAGHYPCRR
jgi:tetratricopeptide (TPR) repeat protein